MAAGQLLVSHLAATLLLVTIVGVLVRGRGRLCWTFLVYLVAVFLGNRLTTWWPEQFYTRGFWTFKSVVYTALDWAIALEVGLLTFAVAPRARRRALALMGVVALAGLAAALLLPATTGGYLHVLGVLAPTVETGALWLLLAVIGVASWHSLPLHPYHRAIVFGRALYLTFDVVILALLGGAGSARTHDYLAALDPLAFAASVGLWAWAAWRPLEERSGVIGKLQPWATRC